MSGEERRSGAPLEPLGSSTPVGPPWSPDVLADFHAGALDTDTMERIRPLVLADPDARDVLAALDATGNDLDGLTELMYGEVAATEIPGDVAARLDAALLAEQSSWGTVNASVTEMPVRDAVPTVPPSPPSGQHSGGQVVDFAARRRRRVGWTTGLLTAAAAVLAVVVAGPMITGGDETPQAGDQPDPSPGATSGPPALALQGDEVSLTPQQFSDVLRSDQMGALSDPGQLLGCLQANGVSSGKPMGARSVTLNGEPAQLLVLPSGTIGQFRLLTVGADCGQDNPATISDTTFGG